MVPPQEQYCRSLAGVFPSVKAILDEHVRDNEQVLPHLFMGDVVRYVMSDAPDRTAIVKSIDGAFTNSNQQVSDLIAVSFVGNLPDPVDFRAATKGVTANALQREWKRQ